MPEDQRNKRLRAVAMRYDAQTDSAPRVIAKGEGYMAERILQAAGEQGIAVHSDPELVKLLSAVDLQSTIPESLFLAVAEVLAFVYQINGRR